jgi:hypothetical protein
MAGSYLGIQEEDNDPVLVTWESDIAKSEENFLEEEPGDPLVVDDDPTPPANNETIPISLEENPETVLLTDPVDNPIEPQPGSENDPRISPEIVEGDTQDPGDPELPDTPDVTDQPIDEPVDPIDEPIDPVDEPEIPRISPETVSQGEIAALDTQLPEFPSPPEDREPIDPLDEPGDDPENPRVSPRVASRENRLLPNLVLPGEPSARVPDLPSEGDEEQKPRISPRPALGGDSPEVLTELLIPDIDDLGEMAPDLDPELLPPLSEGQPGSIPAFPLADANPNRDLEAWLADSSALDRGQGVEDNITEPQREIPRFKDNPLVDVDDLGDPVLPTVGETPRTRFTPALTEDELPELVLPTGEDPADRPSTRLTPDIQDPLLPELVLPTGVDPSSRSNNRFTPDMPESDLPALVIPDPVEKSEVPDTRFTPEIEDPVNPELVIPGTDDLERPSTLVYAGNEVSGLDEEPLPELVLPEIGERPRSSGENPVDITVNPSDNIRIPEFPEVPEIDPVDTDPVDTDPVEDPELVIGDPSDSNGYTSEPGSLRGELLGRVKIITSRDSSKDYIQLGVYGQEESLLSALSRLESYVPLSVLITSTGSYKLLAGPLPRDQVGVLMYHYRSQGFKDAFVLRGR